MSIGLGMSRSSRQDVRIGELRPTIREVSLLGITRSARNKLWTTGQRIVWLGRDYEVVATSMTTTVNIPAVDDRASVRSALDYVHLGPCGGG
jgi:hypothetical protein